MTLATNGRIRQLLSTAAASGRPLRVAAGGNAWAPWRLLNLLEQSVPELELFMLNAPLGIPARAGIVPVTPFAGPGMRHSPLLRYLPTRLSHVPLLLHTHFVPDVVLVSVSEPRRGRVSLGAEVNVLPAAIEACRAAGGLVLAQTTPQMPYTFGDGEIELADLDALCDGSWLPQPGQTHSAAPGGPAQRRIGEQIGSRIGSGATLQLGIGAIPDAVVPHLGALHDLGIWSEMVSDGILDLDRAGALDPDRPVVASFAAGSPSLMAWLHENPRLQVLRTETVNDPARIATNPAMTSINSALAVDLYDQANATHIGSKLHSGFGGQCDFVVGAMHSTGGQALMALRSWHPKADVSAVVALLEGPVTSFQHTAVITEQGTAEIIGHDASTQAAHLIDHAAHPSVRDELREEAAGLGLRLPAVIDVEPEVLRGTEPIAALRA